MILLPLHAASSSFNTPGFFLSLYFFLINLLKEIKGRDFLWDGPCEEPAQHSPCPMLSAHKPCFKVINTDQLPHLQSAVILTSPISPFKTHTLALELCQIFQLTLDSLTWWDYRTFVFSLPTSKAALHFNLYNSLTHHQPSTPFT